MAERLMNLIEEYGQARERAARLSDGDRRAELNYADLRLRMIRTAIEDLESFVQRDDRGFGI